MTGMILDQDHKVIRLLDVPRMTGMIRVVSSVRTP